MKFVLVNGRRPRPETFCDVGALESDALDGRSAASLEVCA